MGIFDNVNWQQMMPAIMGGLSAGAAYKDPRSGDMLAKSGWNSVQAYMQQQKQQQDKLEFEERKKLMQEEQAQRERGLKIREAEETRNSEAQLDEDVFNKGVMPRVFSWKKDNPDKEFTPSALWNVSKEAFDSAGRKPNASAIMKNYQSMRLVAGEDGPVVFRLGPGGVGLEMYQEGSEKPLNVFGKGFDKKAADMFAQTPALWQRTAEGMRARAEMETDPKEKAKLINGAKTFDYMYESERKDKEKIDYQALSHKEKVLGRQQELQLKAYDNQFGTPDKDTGLYPGGPPNETEGQARARSQTIKDGRQELFTRFDQEWADHGLALTQTPKGRRELDKALKDREGLLRPFEPKNEEEEAVYRLSLTRLNKSNIPWEAKVATARVAVTQLREHQKERGSDYPAYGSSEAKRAREKMVSVKREQGVSVETEGAPVEGKRPISVKPPAKPLAGATLTEGAYALSERATKAGMKFQLESAIKANDIMRDINTGVLKALTREGEGILRDLRRLNKSAGRALFGSE